LGSAKTIFNICSYFADRLAALKWDNVAKEINKRELSTYIYLHIPVEPHEAVAEVSKGEKYIIQKNMCL